MATIHYNRHVFVTPPWPEIYQADAERVHSFEDAVSEYDRLMEAFPLFGYDVVTLPKIDVAARADFVLAQLGERPLSTARDKTCR